MQVPPGAVGMRRQLALRYLRGGGPHVCSPRGRPAAICGRGRRRAGAGSSESAVPRGRVFEGALNTFVLSSLLLSSGYVNALLRQESPAECGHSGKEKVPQHFFPSNFLLPFDAGSA